MIACNKKSQNQVIGTYKVDKFSIRDSTINVVEFPILELKSDQTFELRHFTKAEKIHGNWMLLRSEGDEETTIQFTFPTKTIEGELKGTIFYFEYPNDPYGGRYDNILYVQSAIDQ